MNFSQALKNTKKNTTKPKAKSKVPIVETSPMIKKNVDDFVKAKKVFKEAKSTMDGLSVNIIDYVKDIQDEDGYNGVFKKSYKVPGNKDVVTVVTTNKFSINADDEPEIKQILGDRFDEMIEVNNTVRMKPEVFQNEELQNFLMEAIGDRFSEFFETVTTLRAKENFDTLLYRVVDKANLNTIRAFCKQAKPSVR